MKFKLVEDRFAGFQDGAVLLFVADAEVRAENLGWCFADKRRLIIGAAPLHQRIIDNDIVSSRIFDKKYNIREAVK